MPLWPPRLQKESPKWTYEVQSIDATSISLVTDSILKIDPIAVLDRSDKKLREKIAQDLEALYSDFASLPAVPEVPWTRLKDIGSVDMLQQRDTLVGRIAQLGCQRCPDFAEHVSRSAPRR